MANVGDCTAMTGPMHLGPAADGLVSGMWRQDARGPVCLRPTTGCGREAPCSPDALYQPGSGTGSGLLADLCAMDQSVYRSQRFERENRIGQRLADREFEQCEFLHCNLSSSDFSRTRFIDCTFADCDLSLIKLTDAALRGATFKDCKLLGVDFGRCKELFFKVAFDRCALDHASFHQRKMEGTRFLRCSMKGTDLEGARLGKASFEHCDLDQATFVDTDLRTADLSTAYNLALDPDRNKIKGARFSMEGALALLGKYGLVIG